MDTLFPYTTLFRSQWSSATGISANSAAASIEPSAFRSIAAEVNSSVSDASGGTASASGMLRPSSASALRPRRPVRCTNRLRSEEHTAELQSLMRTSYAVFCLKKKKEHKERQK